MIRKNIYEALVYLKASFGVGKPSEEYKNVVIEGAKHCRLPEDYISKFLDV